MMAAIVLNPSMQRPGRGGHIEIGGLHIYGLGYIGAQAGSHVGRICEAVTEHWYDQLFLISHDVAFTEVTDQIVPSSEVGYLPCAGLLLV